MMTAVDRQIARLETAITTIAAHQAAGYGAAQIISVLEIQCAARLKTSPANNTLSLAGVSGNCTYSTDAPLLNSWVACARRKLAKLKEAKT